MRALSDTQKASFGGDVLTIASIVEITATDGTVIKLTDHDQDLADYVSRYGVDLSAIQMQLGAMGQTASVSMLPDRGLGGGITVGMVEKGLLDNALIKCYLVDYMLVPLDPIQIFTGFVSDVKYGTSSLVTMSIASRLSSVKPLCRDLMSQTCRADFGDPACGIDLTNMTDGPHVYDAIDSTSFVMSRDEQTPPGYYNNGTCYFTQGDNKGLGYEILTVSRPDENGRETIYLKVPLAFDVKPGQHYELHPGCDKIFSSGCAFWNNQVNFQGEPFLAAFNVQTDIIHGGG